MGFSKVVIERRSRSALSLVCSRCGQPDLPDPFVHGTAPCDRDAATVSERAEDRAAACCSADKRDMARLSRSAIACDICVSVTKAVTLEHWLDACNVAARAYEFETGAQVFS